MKIENVLTAEELTALRLRALYAESGYQPYKMSKFEAYDLYAGNKDFLASDRIITFTDVSGRLMALKPDVTLSIIKNTELLPGETQKLYYNETVYRVPKGAPGFREMTQVGLECIGETDISAAAEVLSLACRSLGEISAESVLDLSHFGLIGEALRGAGLYGADAEKALACLNDKNAEGMAQVCRTALVPKKMAERLGLLVTLYGAPDAPLSSSSIRAFFFAFAPASAIVETRNTAAAAPRPIGTALSFRLLSSGAGSVSITGPVVSSSVSITGASSVSRT